MNGMLPYRTGFAPMPSQIPNRAMPRISGNEGSSTNPRHGSVPMRKPLPVQMGRRAM